MTTIAEMFDTSPIYNRYAVTIQFRDRLVGGTPRNKELLGDWIKARTGFEDAKSQEQIADIAAHIEEVSEKSWIGFQVEKNDEKGLFIPTRNIKSHLRECCNILKIIAAAKKHVREMLEIKPPGEPKGERLYLGKMQPDGVEERVIHVDTPLGPRSAIKKTDYVEKQRLSFEVWILGTSPNAKHHLGKDQLVEMLRYGQEGAIGADRSQGYGKYDVIEFSQIGRAHSKEENEDKA
jgi:hypothetical protein